MNGGANYTCDEENMDSMNFNELRQNWAGNSKLCGVALRPV